MERIPKELRPPSQPEPEIPEWKLKKMAYRARLLSLWVSCISIAGFAWGSWELCMWWISRKKHSDVSSSQNIVRVIKPRLPTDKQKQKLPINKQKDEEQKYFE